MNLGVITDKRTDDAVVSATLEGGNYLIIVDADKMAALGVIQNGGEGENFADALLNYDCEAVVCGTIQKPAFDAIAGKDITRYNGVGLPLGDAVELAVLNHLPLIVDFEGGPGCADDLPHDNCNCGEEH